MAKIEAINGGGGGNNTGGFVKADLNNRLYSSVGDGSGTTTTLSEDGVLLGRLYAAPTSTDANYRINITLPSSQNTQIKITGSGNSTSPKDIQLKIGSTNYGIFLPSGTKIRGYVRSMNASSSLNVYKPLN